MKRTKTASRRQRMSFSPNPRDSDSSRRREDRYLLIAEIVASKKQADSYSDYGYGSNWDGC